MRYGEILVVCSLIHTKRINTLCGQNVEYICLSLVVHKVTTGLRRVSLLISWQCRPTPTHQLVYAVRADYADEDCASYTHHIARSQEGVRHG